MLGLGGCEPPLPPASSAPPVNTSSATSAQAEPAPGGSSAAPPSAPLPLPRAGERAVHGRLGVVSSEDELASKVGRDVLAAGGNAVDAAVAMAFVLSVTHPVAGALGGGGFLLVRAPGGELGALDFREEAPSAITPARLARSTKRSAYGYASAPVPGLVAGLALARDRFGSRPLSELVAPARRLAKEGHELSARQAKVLGWFWDSFRDKPLRRLLGARNRPLKKGALLKQPALARTLAAIAERGADGFYRGSVAASIARAMARGGGLVTEEDLGRYRPRVRTPLRVAYRGLDVYTMPPPSMGGVALAGILSELATRPPLPPDAPDDAHAHALVEAARRAYADRRSVGADPEANDRAHLDALLGRLLEPEYHARRQPAFDPARATPSAAIKPLTDEPSGDESPETTHLSVVDREGWAVSLTLTLSAAFGARVLVPEIGVILSNALGAFSPQGVNVAAPGKRMASSMSPTLVVANGATVAVLGSPGGDTIPNTIAQILVSMVDRKATLEDAIDAPRIHHQHRPDRIRFERKRPPPQALLEALQRRGHEVRPGPDQGAANCIVLDPATGTAFGYADTRKGGLAIGPEELLGATP